MDVPTTGTYRIIARGAQGAPAEAAAGGRGVIITGEFNLVEGEKLQILVGQTSPVARSGGAGDRLYRSSGRGGGSYNVGANPQSDVGDNGNYGSGSVYIELL